jgi:hypothetical protein
MKPLDEIECPQCGAPIPVSEALRHQLTQHIREELEEKVGQREKDLAVKEKELNDKAKQLGEEEKEIEQRVASEVASAVATRETELQKREEALAVERTSLDKHVREALAQERTKLETEAKKRAEEAVSVEVKDMQERLRENGEKLEKAEQNELTLRKRERELIEKEKTLALETERRIAAEQRFKRKPQRCSKRSIA